MWLLVLPVTALPMLSASPGEGNREGVFFFFLTFQTKRSEPGRPKGRATFTEQVTQTKLGIGLGSAQRIAGLILKDRRLPNLSQLAWGTLNNYSWW